MNITSRLATSPADIQAATSLITSVYQKAGYARDGESSSISAFLALPATVTFLTYANTTLMGTLSVVADSPARLPMDLIFKDKLDLYRRAGEHLAEAGQFAIDRDKLLELQKTNPGIDRAISLELFKLTLHYCIRKGFTLLCIAVNPKHEVFYRWMGFDSFAETRAYPSVEQAPAVPMQLELANLESEVFGGKRANAILTEIFKNPPEEAIVLAALAKVGAPSTQTYPVPSR